MAELRFEPALALADLPRGKMRACTIDGRSVLLCHTKDGLHAVDNICTHAYARLDEGWLRNLPGELPVDLLQALERTGHSVQRSRRLVPMPLEDGRRVVVPVDQFDVHYVGNKAYQ